MALRLFSKRQEPAKPAVTRRGTSKRSEPPFVLAPVEPKESDPLKLLFQQQRDAVILRQQEQWRKRAEGDAICKQAAARLEEQMALVPAGRVSLSTTLTNSPGMPELESEVEPFLLDVHTVTNARFQAFVDAGAYEDLTLWPKSIWPHLIEMRDQTGTPGPRFWRDGRHNQNLADHPVVGVCWYEAMAYVKWVGLRLPSEAEWQMAATWRIKSETDILRRFPWGDAMDREKCNIWSSNVGATSPVDAYKSGAAPNGVLQLVGNVWEWLENDLSLTTDEGVPIVAEVDSKATRGGAYDTYFEAQATGLFRTGHLALTRAHNVGFRCALSFADAPWLNAGN